MVIQRRRGKLKDEMRLRVNPTRLLVSMLNMSQDDAPPAVHGFFSSRDSVGCNILVGWLTSDGDG